MIQLATVSTVTLILFGFMSIYCLSISYLIPYVNSTTDYDNNEPHLSYSPDTTTIPSTQMGITVVEFVVLRIPLDFIRKMEH